MGSEQNDRHFAVDIHESSFLDEKNDFMLFRNSRNLAEYTMISLSNLAASGLCHPVVGSHTVNKSRRYMVKQQRVRTYLLKERIQTINDFQKFKYNQDKSGIITRADLACQNNGVGTKWRPRHEFH